LHLPEIDRYAELDTAVHRWDVRLKIVCLGALLLAVVLCRGFASAGAGLAVALALVALSRIPVSFVFTHVRWVLLFCLFLLIVLPLTAGGAPAWEAGPLSVSRAGLHEAALISVRALAAVLLIFPMLGTARFHLTLKALQRLRVPAAAVQILAFSYRYVFVLFDELGRMLSAARARGHGRTRGLRMLRNVGSMVGMLMVRSLDRTERVHRAMVARGYRGRARALDEFRLRPSDVAKGAAVLAAAAGILSLGILT
jgi:cobalt/nickel transport system permease protein